MSLNGKGFCVQSSLKECQLIPQSCSNPVLETYKKYLLSCYGARTIAQADKYLPTMEAPYINLAMIQKGDYDPNQRDEFTRKTLHGGVDQILQNKKPIKFEDLFTCNEGSKPVRFILVEGPPGIGKSTFAWELCRRWDQIEALCQFNIVVLLKLREKWVLNAISLSDLFRYPPDPDYSRHIAKELNYSHGNGILLVLDGFDEVSHNFHKNSVVQSILSRKLLPKCTIIITTRPSAKHTLRSDCQPQVDKHVEIIGFTEEERVRYITEVFSNKPELQGNFLTYMFLVPHIKSMMYIPLNCAIIAQVYYESQSSQGLAIPKTRTQLYKALTHSLLVRYMKESNYEYTSMLPENLKKEHFIMFKTLAKFAFDSYHKGKSRKVTFFKEDIPLHFAHLGFMNECTEMYASKGVEQTFSFLHLSLQEYLAAWHLANNYSTDFQVAYHRLALSTFSLLEKTYNCFDRDEDALLSSLANDTSLVEPAVFLAGITGWKSQSKGYVNEWETYLSHDTCLEPTRILVHSLYETQNPNIISHYFAGKDCRKDVVIGLGLHTAHTPYDCYALTYCLQHSMGQINLDLYINDDDVLLIEIFVKGLIDHCSSTSGLEHSRLWLLTDRMNDIKVCMYHLTRAKFLLKTKALVINSKSSNLNSTYVQNFLQSLTKLQYLEVHIDSPTSWEWLTAIKSLSELRIFHISSDEGDCLPPSDLCWPTEHNLTQVVLDIKSPSRTTHDLCSSTDMLAQSLLKSVLSSKSNLITKIELPNVTRGIMANVQSIIRHCPSLEILDLKRTRLGYDGILYICSALRYNNTLRYLMIDEDPQFPPSRITKQSTNEFITFSSMVTYRLPSKTTCTNFILELDGILKDNSTLEGIKIQCGLFLPLSAGEHGEYCQWTGLGPLQQYNLGALSSGISPNLRRSFSSSDLTQPQTHLFWDKWLSFVGPRREMEVDFKRFFSLNKDNKKCLSRPSFTAPDTELLQPLFSIDNRLKECLEIFEFQQYLDMVRGTFYGVLEEVSNIPLH